MTGWLRDSWFADNWGICVPIAVLLGFTIAGLAYLLWRHHNDTSVTSPV